MFWHGVADRLTGKNKEAWSEGKIRGTVRLVKKEVLDVGDFNASLLDGVHRILGWDDGVAFQLVSATAADPSKRDPASRPPPPTPLWKIGSRPNAPAPGGRGP